MKEAWLILIAFVSGFLLAQIWKLIAGLISGYRMHEIIDFKTGVGYFTRSGGMPSGHAASFTAATVLLGCMYGFDSGLFTLAVCVWAIVAYDAMHVRYAVGIQGKALNELLKKAGKAELPITEGHTLPQVVVGTILGIAIGAGLFWFSQMLMS